MMKATTRSQLLRPTDMPSLTLLLDSESIFLEWGMAAPFVQQIISPQGKRLHSRQFTKTSGDRRLQSEKTRLCTQH